ncbi:ferritin-like domain-containing protein [Arhodomonas sp. AD133]|uniref:ferritin-like domain-containing protein n=1 Tax=Arhodomonas sp. AD133 TaxID=3415009 RepID=UPI003EB92D97
MSASGVLERLEACIDLARPDAKVDAVHALRADWQAGQLSEPPARPAARPIGPPGRPERPELVPPRALPRRRLGSVDGRAALIHAVTHIEFNAINLALDAAYRFRGLPRAYYDDWLRVAEDEARHFTLLARRLEELGYAYGDFPAHNGLWEMVEDTAHDVLVRMALVPRVLEARGLDVTPDMIRRLEEAGDSDTADILRVILDEEVPHVAIGSRWFRWACEQRDVDAEPTFRELLGHYMRGRVKGPFNVDARLAAGFSSDELAALEALDRAGQPDAR